MLAEFENKRRKEFQKQSKPQGRKSVITKELIAEVQSLKKNKNLSITPITQIAKTTGRGRNTIYKVLKNKLGYLSNRLVKATEIEEEITQPK